MGKYTILQKKERKDILQKAVLGMLSTGMMTWPSFSPAYATEITRVDGATADVHNGNMYKIYAGSDAGNGVGVSRFNKFDVTQGDIANMYFGTSSANTAQFNTLMNFVNNRININGTVNAIRNGKIGGHLFFLSPNGMVVGASGAINTGSLTVITPTTAWWNDKVGNNIASATVDAVSAMAVPINASGTIAIQGKVNATDDIRMKAGKINIGMDITDGDKTAAQLITGTTDFTDLVNMSGTDLTDAGVTNLTATRTLDSGDIILAAEVSYNENKNVANNTVEAIVNIDGGSIVTAAKDVNITATATNNVDFSVYVNKSNEESNEVRYRVGEQDLSESDFKAQYDDAWTAGQGIGTDVTTMAKININDGKVTGKKVNVNAKAEQIFSNSIASSWKGFWGEKMLNGFGFLLNGLDAAYADITNTAEVNVGENSLLTATADAGNGDALQISAKADVDAYVGTKSLTVGAMSHVFGNNCDFIPSVNVNYVKVDNEAAVHIDGDLKAENGNVAVRAEATDKLSSIASTGVSGLVMTSGAVFNFAVNVVDDVNKANLSFGRQSSLDSGKNITVISKATNALKMTTELATSNKAVMAFLVNYLENRNEANVDVQGTLASINAGNVVIDAESIYTENTFSGRAGTFKNFLANIIGDTIGKNALDDKILGKFTQWLGERGVINLNRMNDTTIRDKIADLLKAGISYGYMDETGLAKVNFGKDAKVTTAGDLSVNAISDVQDVHTNIVGGAANQTEYYDADHQTHPGALLSGAIFLRNLDYGADIVLNGGAADGAPAEGVVTLGGKKVQLNAQALAPYNRINKLKEPIFAFCGITETEFKNNLSGDLTDGDKEALWQAYNGVVNSDGLQKLLDAYDSEGNLKAEYTNGTKDYSELIKMIDSLQQDGKVQDFCNFLETGEFKYLDNSGVEHTIEMEKHNSFMDFISSFVPGLFAFVVPENYFSCYTGSYVGGRLNENANYGLNVNYALDKVNNNAQILVGNKRQIETVNGGDLQLKAVTLYGDLLDDGSYLPSLNGGDKLNASVGVGVHGLNNNSIITVAEGAKLKANHDLVLRAETDVTNIAVALGMGSSRGTDVSGAVDLITVNSNNIVAVDDEATLDAHLMDINGYNNTNVIGIAGGFAVGYKAAGGIAVNIIDVDRNNIVGIMDNDAVATLSGTEYAEDDTDKLRQQKVLAKTITLDSAARTAFFGTSAAVEGKVTADALDVGTVTEGDILNVVADFSIVDSKNTNAAGKMASLGNWFENKKINLENKIGQLNNNFLNIFGLGDENWAPIPGDMEATNPHAGEALPSLTFTGVASLGINEINAKTAAVLDGVKITLNNTGDNNVLNTYAGDRSLIVAATGGLGFNFTNAEYGSTSDKALFTGAAAVNTVKNDVHSLIANSEIKNADRIVNTAEQAGDLGTGALAADVARTISSSGTGGGAGYLVAGASLNFADYSTSAELKNNKVNEGLSGVNTDIKNTASNKSYQFTANASAQYVQSFKTNGGVGAGFAWGKINNDTSAIIEGGKYLSLGGVENHAFTDITGISAVLGVGIANSNDGSSSAFQGAVGFNVLDNNVTVAIRNVTEMNAQTLSLKAYDTTISETDTYKKYVSGKRLAETTADNKTKLERYHFDTTGETYVTEAKNGMDQGSNDDYLKDHGNSIITAAVEVNAQLGAAQRTNVAIGMAGVYNNINNDFASEVTGSTITLSGNSDVKAESTTRAVAVTVGGNGTSHGFAGGGSVGLNFLNNDVIAKVANSTLKTSQLAIEAFQRNTTANLAGQISISDLALGLSWAENYLNTNTNAFLTDSNVSKNDDGKTIVEIQAEDDALMYAVAATGSGIFGQNKISATANGAVAVNLGRNNVRAEAVGSGKTLKLTDFTVKSVDKSDLRAGAGGLNVGTATVSIGGAFAVNQIGGLDLLHGATANEKQVNSAKVEGYTIELGNSMSVEAEDTARFDTVSVGCGLGFSGSKVAVQGADATTQLDKSTSATISNVNINNGSPNAGQVKVLANTDNQTKTVGVVGQLAFSTDGVSNLLGIGLGRSRNLFTADTTAGLAGGTYKLDDLLVKAAGKQTVENDTIGAGIVKNVVNVGGTFTVNDIDNDTKAILGDEGRTTTVSANKNVGVVSQSDEDIDNYTGKASFAIANTLSMGTSIASNEVTGDTLAKVLNATVTALGQSAGNLQIRDSVNGSPVNCTGLVVDADAKHDFFSAVFTASLSVGYNSVSWDSAGGKVVTANAGVTVNTDYIGGTTQAGVENSDVNKDNSNDAGNVLVKASDYIYHESSNTNAIADVIAGEGAAISVGGGISKNEDERTIVAFVDGNTAAQGSAGKTLNANNLTVDGDSKGVAKLTNTAAAVAGSGLGAGSVNVGVTYFKEDETTKAYVEDVRGKNKGMSITADHKDDVDMYITAVDFAGSVYGGGIGVSVANFDNFSRTDAVLKYSTVEHTADNIAEDVISANNVTDSHTQSANVSIGAAIGGAVGVLVSNNTLQESVYAGVADSTIGTDAVRAKKIDVLSSDNVTTRFNNQNISGSSVVGIGVGVGLNKIDSAVRADVNGSTLYSAGNITVKAEETKNINGTMVAATLGAVDIGVSVLHNYIGLAVAGEDYEGLDEFTKVSINAVSDNDYDAEKAEGKTETAKTHVKNVLSGLKGHITDKTDSRTTTIDTDIQEGGSNKNLGTGEKAGVQTNLLNAKLYAKGNIDVTSHANTNTDTKLGGGNLGALGVNVEINKQHVEEKLGATISGGEWLAEGNITVSALSEGALKNQTVQAGYNGVGVAVTKSEVLKQNEGMDISLTNVKMKANNALSVQAEDKLSVSGEVTAVNVAGVNAAALLNTASDNASGKITMNGGTLQAEKIAVEVSGSPSVHAESTDVGVGLVQGSGMINTAKTAGDIKLTVTGDVKMYAADEITLGSGLYKPQTGDNLQSTVHAVGVSGIGIEVDKSRTYSYKNLTTDIGFIDFGFLSGSSNVKNVNIYASDNTTMKNYIRTTSVGLVDSESNFSQSALGNIISTTVNTNDKKIEHVDNLQVSATTNTRVDDHAKASSGSTIGIMPYAAQVENNVSSSATLTIEGNYEVGSAKFYAEQVADMQLCADALTVTLVGGAGTRVYNTATLNTQTNLDNAKITTTGDLHSYANTTANLNKKTSESNENYMLKGNGVGLVDIENAKAENIVTIKDTLNIKNSELNSGGEIHLGAVADGILRPVIYDYTVNAVGGVCLHLVNNIDSANTINLEKSHITGTKAEKDISLGASDNLEVAATAYSEMSAGAAGATSATTDNTINRANTLNLKSGDIYGLRDINLYAGKDEFGHNSDFTLIARAETYCGALIPFSTDPNLNNSLAQNNSVNVESAMNVKSVRHANVYADSGTEHINLLEARHSMYRDKYNKEIYVATEKGNLSDSGERYNNRFKADGSVTAGISNIVSITIGKTGTFVVSNDAEKAMIKASQGQSYNVYTFEEFRHLLEGGVDIVADEGSGLSGDSFKYGVSEYVSELNTRRLELQKLVSDSSMDADKSAYNGYKAELERINNMIAKLEHIEEGKQIYTTYIEIPDIVASGGNVNVDTGSFYGKGKVEAKGTPSVNITNNTNLMLKVNDIIVDDPGGQLNFNDVSISGTEQEIRDSIARYNTDKTLNVGMNVIVPAAGEDNKITITGKWSGSPVYYGASSYVLNGKTVKIDPGCLYALANIEINGNINSKKGNVYIESEHNDINIDGGAGISGKLVKLHAPNGTIAQGFTDGIVNIGGSVQAQFSSLYNDFINSHRGGGNSSSTYSYSQGGTVPNGGRIDGGEIYINAADININGTIQSGYGSYYVDIDEASISSKINSLKNNNRNGNLTDEAVLGNPKYCVIEGKDVLTADDYYKRQVAVYYNPSTDNLLVENVDASGGKIYLTGRISSTGNGKIFCLDGAYNIDVTSNSTHNLKTNNLVVNDVAGLVQFTDVTTGVKTQVTSNGIKYLKVVNGEEMEFTPTSSQVASAGYRNYVYTPTSGLKYNWTTGYSQTNYEQYYKEFMAKWWGLADEQDVSSGTLNSWCSEAELQKSESGANENRPNGEYIGSGNGSVSDEVYIKHNYTAVSEESRLIDTRRWTTGYLGCHKRWSYTWKKTTGTVQSDVISVKADNPFNIKFIGDTADNSHVKITANNSNVILNGNIGNMQGYDVGSAVTEKGSVEISAANGAVQQKLGSIYGASVNLADKKGFEGINITNGNKLDLTVDVTGSGNIGIRTNDRTGASVGDNISTINVLKLTGANADLITLTADGNIVQAYNQITAADRIDLESRKGSIYGKDSGGAQSYFVLRGGQNALGSDTLSASVNASAKGDIWLKQDNGNLRVGKIYADDGDIHIAVPEGGLVDALPYVMRTAIEEDELLEQWKGMGIIEGGDSALIAEKSASLQATRNRLIEKIDQETDLDKKAELQAQLDKTPEQYKVWDKDLLLYQLDDSIVNPKAGVKSSDKDPNLFGKNIYIEVKNGVGLNSDNETRINMTGLDTRKNDLKTLSQVDPSTVTWETNADGDSIAVIKDRLAIGVQQSGVGSISITTTGSTNNNVFVESRKDKSRTLAAPYVDLDIAKIAAGAGNVTITSLGSINDVNTASAVNANNYSTVATIAGGNIMLLAGEKGTNNGNIGSATQYMRLYADGNLTATATGNIYLEQAVVNSVAKDMNVVTMTAGVENESYSAASGNIYLRSAGSIYGVKQGSQLQGYIRSDSHGEISLDACENIGYALNADDSVNYDKTLRIKNTDKAMDSGEKHDSITLKTVSGNMNLEGVSTALIDNDKNQAAGGQLNFASVSCGGQKFILTVNGDLEFIDEPFAFDNMTFNMTLDFAAEEIRLLGTIQANDITFRAATKIYQDDGVGSVVSANNITMIAGERIALTYGTKMKVSDAELQKASVVQQYVAENTADFTAPKIIATNLTVKAPEVDMGSANNRFTNAHVDANNNVFLVGGGLNTAGDISIDVTNSRRTDKALQGNIDLRIYKTNSDTTLNNALTIKGDLIAAKDIVVFNEQGDLNLVDSHDDGMTDEIIAGGSFVTYSEGTLTNGKLMGVNNTIGVIARNDIKNLAATYIAGQGIYLESLEGDVYDDVLQANKQSDGSYTAVNGSITLIAEKGEIHSSAMYMATGDVTLKAGHSITNEHGIISSEGNVMIYTLGLQDSNGVYTDAGTLTNNAQLAALKGSVTLYAHHDLVNNDSIEASEGLVTIIAGNEIVNGANVAGDDSFIHGNKGVNLVAGNKLTNNQDIYADNGNIMVYGTGVFKGEGTQFGTHIGGGWVINNGNLYTKNGNVLIEADSTTKDSEGYNLKNSGNMYAGNGKIHLESAHASVYNVDDFQNDFLNPTTAETSGSIALLAEEGSIVNNISLHAGTGITIHSKTDIDNTAYTLTSDSGNVELVSNEGHVINTSTIGSSNGSVIMHGNLKVTNSGDIYATGGDIILKSATSYVTYANTHDYGGSYTDGGIRLLAEQGSVNVNTSLHAQKDIEMLGMNLTLSGGRNITSEQGDIILTAQNYLKIGEESGPSVVILTANDGDVLMQGKRIWIYEKASVIAKHDELGNKLSGRVYVNAENGYESRFDALIPEKITADGDVNISVANGFITNGGSITVKKNGNIDMTAKQISNAAKLETAEGNILLYGQESVFNNGACSITGNGNIEFTSTADIVRNTGSLTIFAGNVVLTAYSNATNVGILTVGGNTSGGGSVNVFSEQGWVSNEGSVNAQRSVQFTAKGNITNTGAITSGNVIPNQPLEFESDTGITMLSATGSIDSFGDLQTTNMVDLLAAGDIKIKDSTNIRAYSDVKLLGGGEIIVGSASTRATDAINSVEGNIEMYGGSIKNYAKLTAGDAKVALESNGALLNAGNITAAHDVSIRGSGNVSNAGAISITDAGDVIIMMSNDYNSNDLLKNTGNIYTNAGTVLLSAEMKIENSGAITSNAAGVYGGDIKILSTKETIYNNEGANIKAASGGINIIGYGKVTNRASLLAQNGDLYLTSLGGDLVNVVAANAEMQSSGNVSLMAEHGSLSNTFSISVPGDVTMKARYDLTTTNYRILSNEGDVLLMSYEGTVINSSDHGITALNGSAGLYGHDIVNSGSIYAKKTVELVAIKETNVVFSDTTLSADYTLSGNVVNDEVRGTLQGDEGVFIGAGGSIANAGAIRVIQDGNVSVSAITGTIGNSGNITILGEGDVTVHSGGAMTNSGSIKAPKGYVSVGANGIWNYATIEAQESITMLSLKDIYNGDAATQGQATVAPVTDETVHIYAGKDVVILSVEGLDNRAALSAGVDITGGPFPGGNVILDDFEIVKTDLLSQDVKKELKNLTGLEYEDLPTASHATIKNFGRILAAQAGDADNGIVHLDSRGKTENYGEIYSIDGEVFMDSTEDLVNHGDIHVLNTDQTNTISCDVTLQATGNLYNTGDIYVMGTGKGAVLLNADAMDQDGLDFGEMSAADIAGHLKTSMVDGHTFKGIYNTGDIYTSRGDITFKSMYGGDIYNTDELTSVSETVSHGNILMNAPLGSIENTKALYATENIEITSYSHIYNLPALKEDTASGTEPKSIMRGLTSENGHIKITSNNGAIVNAGIIETKNGDIILEANGYITYDRLTDKDGDGEITLDDYHDYGDQLTEIKAGIYNHADSDYIANGGNIEITSVYTIDASGSFTALKKDAYGTEHTGKGNITVTTSDTTDGDIYHYAHEGTIIKDINHTVEITETYTDDDLTYEMVRADGTVKYTAAGKAYLITDIVSGDGVKLVFDEGTTISKEIICLNGDVTIQTKGQNDTAGDLFVSAKITSGGAVNMISAGNLKFDTTSGAAEIKSKDDITLTAERDIKVIDVTKFETQEGDLEIVSNKGNIDVTCDIIAENGDVTIQTKGQGTGGDALVNAKITSGGAVNMISAGNLTFGDEGTDNAFIETKDDITLTAERDIKVIDATKFETQEGGLELTSNKGGIDVTGDIVAKEFVRLYTKGGSEDERAGEYAERFEEGTYTPPAGTASGSIADPGIKVHNNITTEGSLDIATYGDDIRVQNLTAGEMAVVGTQNGKIEIGGTIKGESVALYSEAENANISYDNINVQKNLVLAGNNWNVDLNKVDMQNDTQILIYGTGESAGGGGKNVINYNKGANEELHITTLTGSEVEIHSDGPLVIDNLCVSDKAELFVMGVKTDVYGKMNPYDKEAAVIYYAPGQGQRTIDLSPVLFGYDLEKKLEETNKLAEDPHQFETGNSGIGGYGNGGGMRLQILDKSQQYFDGIVLADTYGSNVMPNRYSATDTMIFLENMKAQTQFDNYFNIGFNFYERYNNIYIPDVTVNSIALSPQGLAGNGVVIVPAKDSDEYEF